MADPEDLTDELSGPLDDDKRITVLYTFAGYLSGIHGHLDDLRDGYNPETETVETYDSRNPIDYNIEIAQQRIEDTTMRLEQVIRHLNTRAEHEFEVFEGASGMVCTAMVMRDGGGDQCGLPAKHPFHVDKEQD